MIGKFTISGDLEKALNAKAHSLKRELLYDALFDAGESIRSQAERLAPQHDEAPHIKDNIRMGKVTKIDGIRLHDTEAAIAIGPTRGFFYGMFQEFGTRFHSPQPFMRPAWDQEHKGALIRLGGFLWNRIKGSAQG